MLDASGFSRLDTDDSGMLARGKWFWLTATAWMAALFGATLTAFIASVRLPDWSNDFHGHEYACAIQIPAATMLLYFVAVWFGERRQASELAPSRAPLELLMGALVGFTFISLVLLLLWALGLYSVTSGHWRNPLQYLVFNSYVSALMEELAFRAILLRIFARMFGPFAGLIISAVLFGLAHASHASAMAIVELTLNGGLFLGLLYLVSGRLWLPIGAHLAYDFTEWSLMGVGDKDGLLVVTPTPGNPAWLTGGEFGPDGSVLAIYVGIAVMVVIVVIRVKLNGRSAARVGPPKIDP